MNVCNLLSSDSEKKLYILPYIYIHLCMYMRERERASREKKTNMARYEQLVNLSQWYKGVLCTEFRVVYK